MGTNITNPEESWKLSPEMDEIVSSYLRTSSVLETAQELGVPKEKVQYYLNKPEAKRLVDNVMLEQTYLHRHKLQNILSNIIEQKLEELEEEEMTSSKDIIDIIALAHKMNNDYEKINAEPKAPTTQINQQFNSGFGENYSNLMDKLEHGNK